MRKIIVALLMVLLLAVSVQAVWWDDGWKYQQPVDLKMRPNETLSDFTMPFKLDTATLIADGKMQSDCDDVRFVTANNTEITHCLQFPTDSNFGCDAEDTTYWLKIPTVEADVDTTIYIYYGNDSVAYGGSDCSETFDDSTELAYGFSKGTGSVLYDMKSGYNGTISNAGWVNNSPLTYALDFGTVDDYNKNVNLNDNDNTWEWGDVTVDFWWYPIDYGLSAYERVIWQKATGDGSTSRFRSQVYKNSPTRGNNTLVAYRRGAGDSLNNWTDIGDTYGVWHYSSLSIDDSAKKLWTYHGGEQVGYTYNPLWSGTANLVGNTVLGGWAGLTESYSYSGYIGFWRTHNVVRPASWHYTTANWDNYTLGAENCTTDWYCDLWGDCNTSDLRVCISAEDNNTCGYNYTGDYSEFGTQACDYCTPSWSCTRYQSLCPADHTKDCITVTDSNGCYLLTGLASDDFDGNYSAYEGTCGYNSSYTTGDIRDETTDVVAFTLMEILNWVKILMVFVTVGVFAYEGIKRAIQKIKK